MINFSKDSTKLICTPEEDIVASNVPEMRDILITRVDNDHDWSELIMDCSNVKTLDSIGINLIVGLYKKATTANKIFKVTGCSNSLFKVLKLFRLNERFEIITATPAG